jgi:hypothetical protein
MIKDFSGDFLNFESSNDGDIVEILDEGVDEYNDTLKKDIYNIKVKKGDKVMKYSPNNEAGRMLQQAFGKDSKDWIGCKFEVIRVAGKMKIRPIKIQKA